MRYQKNEAWYDKGSYIRPYDLQQKKRIEHQGSRVEEKEEQQHDKDDY